jgi:hypothetical protein
MFASRPREKHLIAFLLLVFLLARLLTWLARDEVVSTILASHHVLAHEIVDFRVRRGIRQGIEGPTFGQLLRGAIGEVVTSASVIASALIGYAAGSIAGGIVGRLSLSR